MICPAYDSNGFLENSGNARYMLRPQVVGLFDEEKETRKKKHHAPFPSMMSCSCRKFGARKSNVGGLKKKEILQKHKRRNYLSHLGILKPPSISP